ncbi:MAG: glycosyltransferase family 4 protein [Flavobacteriales bacterium]|jgi:glycosyltransferase involved in cell wall biosynthesis|nr:glycosyltransferase family 4 protein [Flavobacteriales bacterium]
MKVLLVNATDTAGGAARAAHRLMQALPLAGVEARMLVQARSGPPDPRVDGPHGLLHKAIARVKPRLDLVPARRYPNGRHILFSSACLGHGGFVRTINASDADVVHLHWINGGMLSVEELARIRKPVVWSLHDMWALTGGCHYDEGCDRWRTHCGRCPVLGSDRERDLSHRVFGRKMRHFAAMPHLTVVGLSSWMARCAQESPLLGGARVVHLPNPVDTAVFTPVDRRAARERFGLPPDRPVVLFGAMNATDDPRKGFAELSAALRTLPPDTLHLAVFGADRPAEPPDLGHPASYLGTIHADADLCALYNAADVTVLPSLQENLSNTVMESLACGTPVVAFAIGGNADMVDDRVNGALARPFDPVSLAEAVRWAVEHPRPEDVRTAARRRTVERFAMAPVAARYAALYREVTGR